MMQVAWIVRSLRSEPLLLFISHESIAMVQLTAVSVPKFYQYHIVTATNFSLSMSS